MLLDGQGLVWAEDRSPEGRGLPHAGRAEVPFYVIVWVRAEDRGKGVETWRSPDFRALAPLPNIETNDRQQCKPMPCRESLYTFGFYPISLPADRMPLVHGPNLSMTSSVHPVMK